MTPKFCRLVDLVGYLVTKMVLSNYIVTSWGETIIINPWKLVWIRPLNMGRTNSLYYSYTNYYEPTKNGKILHIN